MSEDNVVRPPFGATPRPAVTDAAIERNQHLVIKAIAIALETMDRAHPRHRPDSDADDMASLYLSMAPGQTERAAIARSVHWLFAGGLDCREREPPPIVNPDSPPGGRPAA